jgi:uncharacterized protein with ATP-grasp and redox domains
LNNDPYKTKKHKTKTIMANLNPTPATEKAPETVRVVTEFELRNILFAIKGATPATVLTHVVPQMRKTGNIYHNRVIKRQWHNVFLNANYEKSVNKQRVKEGNNLPFLSSGRTWGLRLPESPIVYNEKKQMYYLVTRILSSNTAEYLLENQVIDKRLIEEFLQGPSRSNSQGVENEIIVRDFKMSSIQEVRVNGMVYIVSRPD